MNSSAKFSDIASNHFSKEVIHFLRIEIAKYQGQEIVFGGKLIQQKVNSPNLSSLKSLITQCEIISKGNGTLSPIVPSKISEFDLIIHNHPSSYLEPSNEDLEVASAYCDEVGFVIIDNNVERVNVVIPIPTPPILLNEEKILELFNSDNSKGFFAQRISNFETREAQLDMIKNVVRAFNENKILLCEAETGTGKSLSYGVVAANWALLNQKKVVISTNTINLQEQLLNKDLPIIKKYIQTSSGKDLQIILVKGKNNYLCQKKFDDFKTEYQNVEELDIEEQLYLHYVDEVISWGENTVQGDKNELSFIPNYGLWNKLGCEIDTCRRNKCKHEEKCFQSKIKKAIQKADILIVNHHILCADLAIKKQTGFNSTTGLLPPYERLIIDESHHLEDIATMHFGDQTSTFEIKQTLGLIASLNKKKVIRSGVLRRIIDELTKITNPTDSKTPTSQNNFNPSLNQIFILSDRFITARKIYDETSQIWYQKIFTYFEQFYNSEQNEQYFFFTDDNTENTRKEYKHRFSTEEFNNKLWEELYHQPLKKILKLIENLKISIRELYDIIIRFLENHESNHILSDHASDLKIYLNRIENCYTNLLSSTKPANNDEVRWIRIIKQKKNIQFFTYTSPLDVGNLLNQNLFTPLKTVVLTSATLSTGKDKGFSHIKERWGINHLDATGNELLEVRLANGFNYQKNCIMLVPSEIPTVKEKNFTNSLVPYLQELLQVMKGKMLWLFTSYTMMKNIHQLMTPIAKNLNIELWLQGDQPRHELIQKIKNYHNGVLLGVNSFWEGIDIKGDHLSCLVMIKLPFAVPDEPILAARLERLDALGKNPFMEYSLPQAILRFKQGFGRLIRSEQDSGVFVLFDKRIINKYYGKLFLSNLPEGLTPQISTELTNSITNHLNLN